MGCQLRETVPMDPDIQTSTKVGAMGPEWFLATRKEQLEYAMFSKFEARECMV